jgi:hypothetical protein
MLSMSPNPLDLIGIGPTEAMRLRVSVAVLVRLLFRHPVDGAWMLALERKATLHEIEAGKGVKVKAQPFGGAVRILDIQAFRERIGDFHFDSEGSRSEGDLRIFIRPASWPALRSVCIEHLSCERDCLLESDPGRELTEEVYDALKITLNPTQYVSKPIGTIAEDLPRPSENSRARGYPTVRIYRVYVGIITDPNLALVLSKNSECLSDQDLRARALRDQELGGKGRANAIFAMPLRVITNHYLGLTQDEHFLPVLYAGHQLDETVPAVLEGITVPKYVWL